MMKRLVYTPEAVRQLKAIKTYISDTLNNPKAANDIVGRIMAGLKGFEPLAIRLRVERST